MLVNGLDDGGQDGQENGVLLRVRTGVQQVFVPVGNGPVVMLAGTVDACEGLFMKQAYQAVLAGLLAQNFHHQHVVVDRQVHVLKQRSQFKLRGRHFVVAGLGRDSQSPEFLFHVAHEIKDTGLDGAEIMVFQLLVLGGRGAEKGATRLDQVRAVQVEVLVNEEVFLFRPQRNGHVFIRKAETLHQLLDGIAQCLAGAQQRSLLIQSVSRIRTVGGRDAERGSVPVPLDKGGAGGVPCGVAAGLKGAAQAAGGEAGGVRFAHNQVFAGKAHDGFHSLGIQEGIVLLRRGARHGLEPVRIVSGSPFQSPLLHGVGYIRGNIRVQRKPVLDSGQEGFCRVFGQVLLHHFRAEDIRSVIINADRSALACSAHGQGSDGADGLCSCRVTHHG